MKVFSVYIRHSLNEAQKPLYINMILLIRLKSGAQKKQNSQNFHEKKFRRDGTSTNEQQSDPSSQLCHLPHKERLNADRW